MTNKTNEKAEYDPDFAGSLKTHEREIDLAELNKMLNESTKAQTNNSFETVNRFKLLSGMTVKVKLLGISNEQIPKFENNEICKDEYDNIIYLEGLRMTIKFNSEISVFDRKLGHSFFHDLLTKMTNQEIKFGDIINISKETGAYGSYVVSTIST